MDPIRAALSFAVTLFLGMLLLLEVGACSFPGSAWERQGRRLCRCQSGPRQAEPARQGVPGQSPGTRGAVQEQKRSWRREQKQDLLLLSASPNFHHPRLCLCTLGSAKLCFAPCSAQAVLAGPPVILLWATVLLPLPRAGEGTPPDAIRQGVAAEPRGTTVPSGSLGREETKLGQ
jgi:hypothetical protein